MVTERELLVAVNGEPMRKIHAQSLIVHLLGGSLVLWLHLILLLWTFGENALMASLVDHTGAD
jgi:hypothetical protein